MKHTLLAVHDTTGLAIRNHPQPHALVCRADDLAESLLEAGWLGQALDTNLRDALYALQRVTAHGLHSDALERLIGVEIAELRGGCYVTVARVPRCDVCASGPGQRSVPAYAAAKLSAGPWANVCADHFAEYGCALGTGHGQLFVPLRPGGWALVEEL